MSLNTRKGIYGVVAILTPFIGTACGILGAMMVGIANMVAMTPDQINKHTAPRIQLLFTLDASVKNWKSILKIHAI